jgi:hypothetical protein
LVGLGFWGCAVVGSWWPILYFRCNSGSFIDFANPPGRTRLGFACIFFLAMEFFSFVSKEKRKKEKDQFI